MRTNILRERLPAKEYQRQLEEARHEVAELRAELARIRANTSVCATELIRYCESNKQEDPLLNSRLMNNNPYAEKRMCTML